MAATMLHRRVRTKSQDEAIMKDDESYAKEEKSIVKRRLRRKVKFAVLLMLLSIAANCIRIAAQSGGMRRDRTVLTCPFRQYRPNRFYKLSKSIRVPFLAQGEYIFGKLPFLLKGDILDTVEGKICVSRPSDDEGDPRWGSGTNPTFIGTQRLLSHLPPKHDVLDLLQQHPEAAFLATLTFKTVPSCFWKKDSVSWKGRNPRTTLLLLDDRFNTVRSTIILYERVGSGRAQEVLDDSRIFVHNQELWISYKLFTDGIHEDLQFLSPLHIEEDNGGDLLAFIRESETQFICCGRNMAFLEQPLNQENRQDSKFFFLVQPDPVLVLNSTVPRHYTPEQSKPTKAEEVVVVSGFHGTSGFLIHLPATNEYLGIGHIHRPRKDDAPNFYAQYGHHYTHAFFTISGEPPYRLKRLSPEFIFHAKSKNNDAEIIQFASGLEIVRRQGQSYVVIGYGINDCEGAGILVDFANVNSWLEPVREGEEVSHQMRKSTLWDLIQTSYRYAW